MGNLSAEPEQIQMGQSLSIYNLRNSFDASTWLSQTAQRDFKTLTFLRQDSQIFTNLRPLSEAALQRCSQENAVLKISSKFTGEF